MTAEELAAALEGAVPGAVLAHEEGVDMPTLTVAREHLVDVCTLLRDAHGKNFLSDVTGVDYLGYGEEVAGYFGTERGRDINRTGTWGTPETVTPPPARFSVTYHLAHVGEGVADDEARPLLEVEDVAAHAAEKRARTSARAAAPSRSR